MTKRPFVLVVEDDTWLAEQYIRTLNDAGYETSHVSEALLAMDSFDTRLPDMILLDVFLTGHNAFTLLHEMRSHSDLSMIPVVLCTNSAHDLVIDDLRVYGVVAVLDKTTMQPSDSVAAVRKALL